VGNLAEFREEAVKKVAGNKRVKKGLHYIVKKLTHHGKVESYNKTVSAIIRKKRHIKYLEHAKSLWSARKKTAELAIEKAETNWGKKLAQQRLIYRSQKPRQNKPLNCH